MAVVESVEWREEVVEEWERLEFDFFEDGESWAGGWLGRVEDMLLVLPFVNMFGWVG